MTLDEIALKHGTDKASSHHDYCRIYERYFAPLRDEPINLLEIGVQFGLSIQTWSDYFRRGTIFGVDIADNYKTDNPRVHLFLGDQADPGFWKGFLPETTFDIVVDDGCHHKDAQWTSCAALWPRVKPGGFYIIEDCFTWWDLDFTQQVGLPVWLELLIGRVNLHGKVYHGKPRPMSNPVFEPGEKTVEFVHCYYGLVILKKK
jgi:demethylmacrocin O-methyltransferase